LVAVLGGPTDLLDAPDRYFPPAPCIASLDAPADGWLAGIDTRALGEAVVDLGGGRRQPDDRIDPRVGLDALLPLGTRVQRGQPLLRVHAADDGALAATLERLRAAVTLQPQEPSPSPLVIDRIGTRVASA
jgi:thymidine phosphorylase